MVESDTGRASLTLKATHLSVLVSCVSIVLLVTSDAILYNSESKTVVGFIVSSRKLCCGADIHAVRILGYKGRYSIKSYRGAKLKGSTNISQ